MTFAFRAEIRIAFLTYHESSFLGNPNLSVDSRTFARKIIAVHKGGLSFDRIITQELASFVPVTGCDKPSAWVTLTAPVSFCISLGAAFSILL